MDVYFALSRSAEVSLTIYDVRGRELITLVDRMQEAGEHQVSRDGLDSHGAQVAAGVYFLRYEIDGQPGARRVVRLQ